MLADGKVAPVPAPTREAPLSLAGRAWRAIQLSKSLTDSVTLANRPR